MNVDWDGGKWVHVIGYSMYEDLDVPPPQQHYPHDGQMRDVFACLRYGIEDGTPQHYAFLRVFDAYGEYHRRALDAESRLRELDSTERAE